MKKNKRICKQLGIKQEDLALLLNVNKRQLAMYEIGQRDLPITAITQLVEILKYMQEDAYKSVTNTSLLKIQELQKKKTLEQLAKDNQYKQLQLKKKITVAEKKHNSNLAALQLMEYLENKDSKKGSLTPEITKVIKTKAASQLNKNGLALLTKFQIEKEVLQAEEKIILQFLSV